MAWLVQTLEKTTGGIFHLTAQSDEGGGFYAGCDHDHRSHEEAAGCPVAKKFIGVITGFPVQDETANEVEESDAVRKEVDAYMAELTWSEAATDLEKLLVRANIETFYRKLRRTGKASL